MMHSEIESIFQAVAHNYKRMLAILRPCKPGGEFLEQNLVTLFAHEFLSRFPDGVAFTEVPVISDEANGYWRNRIDGYFATDEFALLLEAKGSLNAEYMFSAIDEDLGRMKSAALRESFNAMKRGGECYVPDKLYGVVLADCWQKKQADKWSSKCFGETYKNINELETGVFKGGRYDNEQYQHFILYGWTHDPLGVSGEPVTGRDLSGLSKESLYRDKFFSAGVPGYFGKMHCHPDLKVKDKKTSQSWDDRQEVYRQTLQRADMFLSLIDQGCSPDVALKKVWDAHPVKVSGCVSD